MTGIDKIRAAVEEADNLKKVRVVSSAHFLRVGAAVLLHGCVISARLGKKYSNKGVSRKPHANFGECD